MSQGRVVVERQGTVTLVILDHSERRNALGEDMWASLEAALQAIEADLPRAVVVTGAGDKAFCAGQDLNPDNPQVSGLVTAVQDHDSGPVRAMLERERRVVDRLVGLPVPVIAAINGVAFGGGAELAVRCDLRVIDPAATVCFSEVKLGLMPDWGGGVALTRLVGPARAADLILTGRRVDSAEAAALGLVNRTSAPGRVREEALALGEAIAHNGPRAVRAALAVIRQTPGLTAAEALSRELEAAVALIASGECVHGIGAFLSKAEPTFPAASD